MKKEIMVCGMLGWSLFCSSVNATMPDENIEWQEGDVALQKAYQTYLKTGSAPRVETQGFEQFAYDVGAQPIVATSPLELTVISLEPGEHVVNVSSGDPLRWSYSLTYSGSEDQRQAHVMIKPSQMQLSTDLVIATDKRLYTLKVVAMPEKYARHVRFWYPKDMQAMNLKTEQAIQAQHTKEEQMIAATHVQLDKLNFHYALVSPRFGSTPSFKPVRVFDDGEHTFIQFADNLSHQSLPALFILNGQNQELVNYRHKAPYFIVDKLFKEAVLVLGVGKTQQRLRIINKGSLV